MMMENNNSDTDYEESEKLLPSQIAEMRTALKDKHGQEVPPDCDQFIARCIRLKDGNVEKAIKLILAFQATIKEVQNWDADAVLQPTAYKAFYDSFLISPLIQRDSHGRRVYVFRLHLWDYKNLSFDGGVVATWMCGLYQYMSQEAIEAQRSGYVIICDFSNFSLQHAWAVKQWTLISLAKWAQNGVVGRIKGIHVIFHSRIVRAIYSAIKPFLKEKLKKRIFFHDDLNSLHNHFEKKGLPNYLGGDLDPESDECVDKQYLKELLLQDNYFKGLTTNPFPCK